jgi:hypothetical protein
MAFFSRINNMIINFNPTDDDFRRIDQGLLDRSVSELLRAHRLGHHLIVISRNVALNLRGALNLSRADDATLARLAQEYTQTADLVRRAAVYLDVDFSGDFLFKVRKNCVAISLEQVAQPYILDRSVIVVEDDVTDGAIYDYFLRSLRYKAGVPAGTWELIHGGGERALFVAASKVRDRRVVCVIVDSDSDSPPRQELAKVVKMRSMVDDQGWPLCWVMPTPCREIENLIPLDLVAELDSAVGRPDAIAAMRRVGEHEEAQKLEAESRYWLYFDVKNGVDSRRLSRMSCEDRSWVEQKLMILDVDLSNFEIKGFGDRVIALVVNSNEWLSSLRDHAHRSQWWGVFGEFLVMAMWVTVAPKRQYT